MNITKEMAEKFYKEICTIVYGDYNKRCGGSMSVAFIGKIMKISNEESRELCDAMVHYGITEKLDEMIIL